MGHSNLAASRAVSLLAAATLAILLQPVAAAEEAPKGAAVTVLKAAKSCFDDIVEVSGIVLAREETAVRPDRPGLKVADVLADPATPSPPARTWRG